MRRLVWLVAVLGGVGCQQAGKQSCTVKRSAATGVATISCPDGSSVDVTPGEAGRDGEDGSGCTVTRDRDAGSVTVSCEDGTTATVMDGAQGPAGPRGDAGTSCTVTQDVDAGVTTIRCSDGTTATVGDGRPGAQADAGSPVDAGVDAGTGTDAGCPDGGCPTCFDPVLGATRPVVVPSSPGDLVISEFMANPAAVTDTVGEWFELYATREVDLNGVQLTAGSASELVTDANCLRLPAGGFGVVARSADAGVNGGLPQVTVTTGLSIANVTGSLSLSSGGTVIDSISWSATQPGASSQLDPAKLDAVLNDGADAFCAATQAYGAGDLGTPGAANTACPVVPTGSTCVDATSGQPRALQRPAVGDLVISEVLADPAGVDSDEEWFEVLVKADVDLNGVQLGNEGSSLTTLGGPACIRPGANSWLVFARKADPAVNGGLPAVAGTFGFSLANSGARAVRVLAEDGGLLDSVSYDTAQVRSGTSWQVDFNNLDALSNDLVSNACFTDAGTYAADGGNRGTPGAFNVRCF
jgi:hypothetical protein